MSSRTVPRYPIYVPSKGRYQYERALTVRFLMREEVPFHVVVEPTEHDAYAALVGEERVLILDRSDGGLLYARNWIRDHSEAAGFDRHWQLDDNIRQVHRLYRGERIPCDAAPAFAVVEDFTDRYENIGISGMNYHMFGIKGSPPFRVNVHVYSCTLINNRMPYRWRRVYNDDTDLCLQVLAGGLCTVAINAFLAEKITTMVIPGGNTDDLYQDDGRLRMARSLERDWPGVVTTDRRFQRPQHVVRNAWRKFDTPLRLRPGLSLDDFAGGPDEYGLSLTAIKPVRSPSLRRLIETEPEG